MHKPDLNGWEAIHSPYIFHCRNIHAFDYRVLATDPAGCYIIHTYCIILLQWPVNSITQDHIWKSWDSPFTSSFSYRKLGAVPCLMQTSSFNWLDSGEVYSCLAVLPAAQVFAIWFDKGKCGKKKETKIKSVNVPNYHFLGKRFDGGGGRIDIVV